MKNKNITLKARIISAVGIIVAVLGLAFLAGAGLAYVQHVETQILPLAATGAICLFAGIIAALAAHRANKKAD